MGGSPGPVEQQQQQQFGFEASQMEIITSFGTTLPMQAKPTMATPPLVSPVLKRPSPFEWEQYRPTIERLWKNDATLKEVRTFLAAEGLSVSAKMILIRIKRWGLDKKNKEPEMAAAARKLQERAALNQVSVITVRGRIRSEAEMRRYARRKGMSLEDLALRARSTTPPAVYCRTPSPTRISDPKVYALPENLLINVLGYVQATISSSSRLLECPAQSVIDTTPPWATEYLRENSSTNGNGEFVSHLNSIDRLYEQGYVQQSTGFVQKAMLQVEKLNFSRNVPLIIHVLHHSFILSLVGRPEVAILIIQHLQDFAELKGFSRLTTLSQFFTRCQEALRTEELAHIAIVAMMALADFMEQHLGMLSHSHLLSLISLVYMSRKMGQNCAHHLHRLGSLAEQLDVVLEEQQQDPTARQHSGLTAKEFARYQTMTRGFGSTVHTSILPLLLRSELAEDASEVDAFLHNIFKDIYSGEEASGAAEDYSTSKLARNGP